MNPQKVAEARTQGQWADLVAASVRAEAGRANRNRQWLSRETGISRSTLDRKWHGHYPYDVDELERLSRALQCPVRALLGDPGVITQRKRPRIRTITTALWPRPRLALAG